MNRRRPPTREDRPAPERRAYSRPEPRRIPNDLSPPEKQVLRDLGERYAPAGKGSAATQMLGDFLMELLHWTKDSNLVGHGDLGRLASRHVAESLAVLPLLDRLAPKRLIDLGSGGGFPAIPIAILRPEINVILVESRRRKGLFLQRAIERLGLPNAFALIARAEKASAEKLPLADVGTARAVAVIEEILPWLAPLIRTGGHAVLFKGSAGADELAAWQKVGDPCWTYSETVPLPDSHLFFLVFERTAEAAPAIEPAGEADVE